MPEVIALLNEINDGNVHMSTLVQACRVTDVDRLQAKDLLRAGDLAGLAELFT